MGSIGLDKEFIKTGIGIFKIVTFVVVLISLAILSSTQLWNAQGLSYLNAGMFAFSFIAITQLISILIYLLKLYNLPLLSRLYWKLLEIVYAIICAILLIIAMIICAVAANQYTYASNGRLECCAVFSGVLLLAFLVFAFMTHRTDAIRSDGPRSVPT